MKHRPFLTTFATILLCLTVMGQSLADVVYITARPTPNGAGANQDLNSAFELVYNEDDIILGDTSATSTVADAPPRSGSRYYASGTDLTDTNSGITLKPDLATPGGVYLLEHSFRQFGNNSTNAIFSVSSTNASLSVSETDVFQRSLGDNTWQRVGYLTNDPGVTIPHIQFRYQSGLINAGLELRWVIDVFRFTLVQPCLDVAVPNVLGPLATNLAEVTVGGVTSNATAVAVYQDSGAGMVKVGELTSGVTEGVNLVPVTGLVKGAVVSATQTEEEQESCVQASGIMVGGGANPRVRTALSIRETSSTGPVGASGSTASANLHFLGATFRTGGAPGDGTVVFPSNEWQTLTFDADRQFMDDPANASGTPNDTGFYNPNDSVVVEVYAFRFDFTIGSNVYSRVPAVSGTVTSNDFFGVSWTWDAVPAAEGYRLLRNVNSDGFNEHSDVFSATNLDDNAFVWLIGNEVTPTSVQAGDSVQWNGTGTGNNNNIGTQWGVLDAIAFAIDDLEDTGPFDLFIDNVQNGSTVFQDFETHVAGAQEVGFRAPGFSGTTGGNVLTAPNQSTVSSLAADTGSKSLRVRFQWNGTNDTKWLRLTSFAANDTPNALVNLDEPVSFRILLLPVNETPVPPPPPTLRAELIDGNVVIDWDGAHTLRESTNVLGPFTPVEGPVTLGPYTNTPLGESMFYRLED